MDEFSDYREKAKPIHQRRKVFLVLLIVGLTVLSFVIFSSWINKSDFFSSEKLDSISLKDITSNNLQINYKDSNMTIEFKVEDSFVGETILKSHSTYDEVLKVPAGNDRVLVWYEFSDFINTYKGALGDVKFLDMRKIIINKTYVEEFGDITDADSKKISIPNPNYLQPIEKSYQYVYLNNGEWLPYTSKDIPKENIIIGIQADIGWGEYLDVVPTFFENDLDRHALVIGTNVGFLSARPVGDPGEIDQTNHFGHNDALKDTSSATAGKITEIGFWADSGATGFDAQTVSVGIYSSNATGPDVLLSGNDSFSADGSEDVWKYMTVNIDIDPNTDYWIGLYFHGTNSVIVYGSPATATSAHDGDAGSLRSPYDSDGRYTFPWGFYAVWEVGAAPQTINVTLLNPTDNKKVINTTIFFNASISPTGLNITNTTLYVWNSSNDIIVKNLTLWDNVKNNITANWTETGFNLGEDYHWNVKAGGNNSEYYWSISDANFTFTASALTDTSQVYNKSVLETSSQTFTQQINAIASVTSAAVEFFYNGTNYAAESIDLEGSIYNVTNTIDVPLALADANKTFYWEWTFTTATQTLKQNSTIFSHEVNKTSIVACLSSATNQTLNFTTHNATNPFPLVDATFKMAMKHWLGSGSTKRNYSYEDVTEGNHSFRFCLSHNKTFYTNADIEYDGANSALNFYYLSNASLTNKTQTIKLYLLDDAKATLTELQTVDAARNPVENITIQIQSYDIGTDTFYTVSMAKTSEGGTDLVYLNWYDTLYKFTFTQDGSVVKTTSPYKISATPQIFDIISETVFEFAKFEDMEYNLYYNATTKNFVYTFTKPSGEVKSSCLRVIKRNVTEDTLICLTCETSTSATLYCNINSYGNGTYIASIYSTGSMKWLDTLVKTIGEVSSEIYQTLGNVDGTVMAIIFSGVVLTFFLISPAIGIVGMILGMLGAIALGFQPVDYASFIGITFVGGIVLWLIQR